MNSVKYRPDSPNFDENWKNRNLSMALLAAIFAVFSFLLHGHMDLMLSDEGYLWYGAQRIFLAGEVPKLDFAAYDIARYYWSAAIMHALGDGGIVSLRISLIPIQAIVLFLSLKIVTMTVPQVKLATLLLAIIMVNVWTYPYFKIFDHLASILLIFSYAMLLQHTDVSRFFLAGLSLGLAAALGRNHGVYGIFGAILIFAYLYLRPFQFTKALKSGLLFTCGVFAGFTPNLVAMAMIPGFAEVFTTGVAAQAKAQSTNIFITWFRPWWVTVDGERTLEDIGRVLSSTFIMLVVIFGLCSVFFIIYRTVSTRKVSESVLIASASLALPYAHYTFSRMDSTHLSLGALPMIFALVGSYHFIAKRFYNLALIAMTAIGFVIFMYTFPTYSSFRDKDWQEIVIGKDHLSVPPGTAKALNLIDSLRNETSSEYFIVYPFWPAAYAAFEQKSPVHQLCALGRASEDFEHLEISRIIQSRPGFAIIANANWNGANPFNQNNPLTYEYLVQSYIRHEKDLPLGFLEVFVLPESSDELF